MPAERFPYFALDPTIDNTQLTWKGKEDNKMVYVADVLVGRRCRRLLGFCECRWASVERSRSAVGGLGK